jgi:predicted ArsR family transcriptional regulator
MCEMEHLEEAIADPVRLRLVRHLEAHPDATLPQLAAAAGVHPNTARPHLATLVDAGVLTTHTAPCDHPGRPPLRYRLDDAQPGPLERALGGMGFDARLDGETLQLADCPCPRLLPERPELICELALAVAKGVAGDVQVTDRAHDPRERRCSARLIPSRRTTR